MCADRNFIVVQQGGNLVSYEKPTRKSVMLDPKMISAITTLIAEFETRKCLFTHPNIERSFNDLITEQTPDTETAFNVTQWYDDHRTHGNWLYVLQDMELEFPGFITLLSNHLNMDRELNNAIERARCNANMDDFRHAPVQPIISAGQTSFTAAGAVRNNLFGIRPATLPGH
jgi:hypothetical protein